MALVSPEYNTLNDLFVAELEDLYDAEKRLVEALPKMETAASSQELKSAFREHLVQTEDHVKRLDDIFHQLGKEAGWVTCQGIKGIISEGEDIIDAKGDDVVRDAGLIGAAQRVEHYEIAAYGTARTFARHLGLDNIADILQKTLREEEETDAKLTQVAEAGINVMARH